ncbi:MAG TPA: hypothetical protein DDZ80_11525 [Cyanobacteria bacterium UBA8803]|nr:hypothetical protein [Cyanobacteria bacterium UBA9273]HBL59116.1 hypothetical protein [Cyanobacteria bacterium UBA8803]
MIALPIIYLLVALQFSTNWVKALQRATDLSAEQKRLCYIVFIVATVFWPIALPISYLEKCAQGQQDIPQTEEVCDSRLA